MMATTSKKNFQAASIALMLIVVALGLMNQGCRVRYSFADVSIPDSINTVRVNFIENRARYVNAQLSPQLTDRIRQKIVGQTRLSQTNGDNADWEISGYITEYSLTTSAISEQQVATNRLNVGVHIIRNNRKDNSTEEYDITRGFDFSANLTLAQAEVRLLDEIIRSLSDDIFNRIFSNW